MNIPRIISQITFGSGYPLGPGGHLCKVNGRPYPIKNYGEFNYPGYPGMVPEPDTMNPFGGILHNLDVVI
jgi:hypothetical protein